MSEENDVNDAPVENTVDSVEVVQESNPEQEIVSKAIEMGWKPLEQFEGPALNWKGAGAFVKDAELFAALKSQSGKISELNAALNDIKGFISKSEEAGYRRALEEVERQRHEAAQMFDIDALNKANDEYLKIQNQMANYQATHVTPVQKSADEAAFEARNIDWYNDLTPDNSRMKNEAILLSQALAQTQPNLTPAEHISVLESKIKKLYPERFVNSRKSEPSAVESNSPKSKNANQNAHLSPEILATANRYVKLGVFPSVDAYVTEAKRLGVIK